MTIHIILPTAEGGIVWATDTALGLGGNNFAAVDKIRYIQPKNAACSSLGNHGLPIANQLRDWIADGRIDLSDSDTITRTLGHFCMAMVPSLRIDVTQPNRPAVILVANLDSAPRVYFAQVNVPVPSVTESDNLICAGDSDNPCRIFVDQYYEATHKTTGEALLLGVHALRKAHEFKAAYIGPPNAWVGGGGVFRRLTDAELKQCIKASEALDDAILSAAANFVLDTSVAPKEGA
jgi:hypothetical protein